MFEGYVARIAGAGSTAVQDLDVWHCERLAKKLQSAAALSFGVMAWL
jgi:hypothetical protein